MPTVSPVRSPRSQLSILLCTAMLVPAGCSTATPEGNDPAIRAEVEVVEASVAQLQEALTAGSLTSVQLVDAYLARIEAYDVEGPALNAIIAVNPEARAEAARLDRERAARGARGPLHGIPVIVKDNFDTHDLPTTGGSIALVEHRPTEDATQVRLLREAGAIILAKANLHELAYGITTISSVGGQTLNPYAPDRNPGGSSGGTAAAIAASFATIGWGTDTCGSIRIPAGVNNLVGLRPTTGISSRRGIIPLSSSQDLGGPLARSIADLAIALDATTGVDPEDPATLIFQSRNLPRFAEELDPHSLEGARIGVLSNYFGQSEPEHETSHVVRTALERMGSLGAEIVEIDFEGLEELLAQTSTIDLEFKWDLLDYLTRTPSAPVGSLSEIVERGLHHEALGQILRRSDRHESRDSAALQTTLARRDEVRTAVLALLEEERLDALAYPSLRREAARIGEPALGNNCQLSAATGMPALGIPAGFSSSGVPIGMELLGPPFSDARLLSLGYAYEQAVEPRRPPALTPALLP